MRETDTVTKAWRDAIASGDLESIDRLLGAGVDIDARDEHNQTALMNAARDGRTAVAGLLIDRGARLDHTAKYGLTALMLAVLRSNVDVVRMLVGAGADLDVRGTGAPGFDGKTALDFAQGLGSDTMIEILRRETSKPSS